MGPNVAQVWVEQSHDNCVVTTVTIRNPLWSNVEWRKFCIHFRSLNFAILEWLKLRIKKYFFKSTFNGLTSLLNFNWFKSY
jgi:hypothetical protein